jgi:hypothetical protein
MPASRCLRLESLIKRNCLLSAACFKSTTRDCRNTFTAGFPLQLYRQVGAENKL